MGRLITCSSLALSVKRRVVLIIVVAWMPAWTLLAQEEDFRGWYSIGLEREFFNQLDVSLSPQIRFQNNHGEVEGYIIEADASSKLTDWFRLGILYRFMLETYDPSQDYRNHRFGVSGKFDYRMKPFDLSYRCIYQQEYKNMYSSENGKIADRIMRHRVQIQYDRKKVNFKPFVSVELFHTMRPLWKQGEKKLRVKTGMERKLNDRMDLSLGYMIQKEFNVKRPNTSYILDLGLTYKWK